MRTLSWTAAAAALLASVALVPGVASAAPAPQRAAVDLDGDGTPDLATLRTTGVDAQRLEFTVRGVTTGADLTGQPAPMRVTDVDGDGRQEVVVTEVVGANTLWYGVWDYDGTGPRTLSTSDGEKLYLYEGGGVTTRLGYECAGNSFGGRDLITLRARMDEGTPALTYSGLRVLYEISDGIAREVTTYTITSVPQDDPVLRTTPESCA
ncbi:VCBS repeat-containing protein [Amycolatopsis sp. NPDC006131]|uniref:VCBS repeat-containing protein n=1 Tax=Amycolatopsis sp. NPDC006131 TaxID=3156731 RepID=UPI0033A7D102